MSNTNSSTINNSWYPDVLVLGPGGMKGFLELGALIRLVKSGYLNKVNTYVGCSVGAIIALLLVAGYTPTEIVSDAADGDIFHDITNIRISDIRDNTGLISNKNIRDKLSERLRDKFGFVPSLQQLYLATGLVYVAVTLNLDNDRTEYLDKDSEPHLSAVDAAMLSMNIPFLFYKLKYKGCVYIDGAFGNPYPVDLYDDSKTNILGIYITTKETINKVTSDSSLFRYLYKVVNSSMTQIKLRIQNSCSQHCKHISLNSPSLDITGLTFNNDIKAQMLIIGYQEADNFLKTENIVEENSIDTSQFSSSSDGYTGVLDLLQSDYNDNYDPSLSQLNESDILTPISQKINNIINSFSENT